MSLSNNYVCEGQMSIFDIFSPDILCGKTYQEPSVQTKEKTSGRSLKKQPKSSVKMPLFLDLRTENGHQAESFWVMGGQLLGEYMMRSFGECPSVENVSLLSQILEVNPHPKYCLSPKACQGILRRAEKRGKELPPLLRETLIRQATPLKLGGGVEVDSHGKKAGKGPLIQTELSGTLGVSQDQTLITKVVSVDEKMGQTYIGEEVGNTLGARDYKQPQAVVYTTQACGDRDDPSQSYQENLAYTVPSNPMSDRGQAVVYGMCSYDSNAMKSSNPHSGIYEAETSRTLDNNGGNPACNQGGMMVLDGFNLKENEELSPTLTCQRVDTKNVPIVLEGNGQRDSHKGDGYKESETMYTLNTVEQHGVCTYQQTTGALTPGAHPGSYNGQDAYNDMLVVDKSPCVYGLDRASFNQGQNAQYDFSIEEEKAQTLVSRGPGGGTEQTVGALCARDYKGVGNQYVNEGKLIVQSDRKPSG